ncbi:uncharacterized protein LOC125681775 [Ostrea edulis]|uniref:uncharacterized protein LOC125681775 n=1 Tax=Ostrea edulis TaxID=37623 RepID=UPI002094681A|nr:uncharacterized protein LOC125681775 [Ostrea edulis]
MMKTKYKYGSEFAETQAYAIANRENEGLTKELDAKELRDEDEDYQRYEEGNPQYNNSMKYIDAQIKRLSKIYNPDKKTVLQELRRLREDPVELYPIERMTRKQTTLKKSWKQRSLSQSSGTVQSIYSGWIVSFRICWCSERLIVLTLSSVIIDLKNHLNPSMQFITISFDTGAGMNIINFFRKWNP